MIANQQSEIKTAAIDIGMAIAEAYWVVLIALCMAICVVVLLPVALLDFILGRSDDD